MISSIRKIILKNFWLCLAMGLISCSNGTLPELHIESVSIYTEPDTNQNSATAVDLVIIYDEELVKILGQMSAAKYFDASKQLLLDNPTLLDIWHWELVPGQVVQNFTPPQEEGDSYAAFVFANYLTPGDHRVRVAPSGIVKVLLLKNDLRNLTQYDIYNVRVGTTMSNVTDTMRGSNCALASEGSLCNMQLGPTREPIRSCKRMGPKTTQVMRQEIYCPPQFQPAQPKTTQMMRQEIYCPPQFQPAQRKPIQIITRPLGPPPTIVRTPCWKKVKKWQN